MSFFSDLKQIIPSNTAKDLFGYDVKLNFSKKSGLKLFDINHPDKLLTIYVNRLSIKEERNLKASIKKHFELDNIYLIEESKTALLERLYSYNDKRDNQILAFFKPILSGLDWQALRDSLFLRNEFKLRNNVGQLKNDIVLRYGERGNVISNMCTAGYFEETMIPLYNNSSKEFWAYYDMAIDRGITALFVNGKMTVAKIKEEIKRRLIQAKAYGLPYIHIHGIGQKNINNINECIEKEKSNLGFTEKNIFMDKKLEILVVEIIL
jgi:hypothetical protein